VSRYGGLADIQVSFATQSYLQNEAGNGHAPKCVLPIQWKMLWGLNSSSQDPNPGKTIMEQIQLSSDKILGLGPDVSV